MEAAYSRIKFQRSGEPMANRRESEMEPKIRHCCLRCALYEPDHKPVSFPSNLSLTVAHYPQNHILINLHPCISRG